MDEGRAVAMAVKAVAGGTSSLARGPLQWPGESYTPEN